MESKGKFGGKIGEDMWGYIMMYTQSLWVDGFSLPFAYTITIQNAATNRRKIQLKKRLDNSAHPICSN